MQWSVDYFSTDCAKHAITAVWFLQYGFAVSYPPSSSTWFIADSALYKLLKMTPPSCAIPSTVCSTRWLVNGSSQLVLTTGIIFAIIQFAVLPRIVRLMGIVTWYRTAWVLTVVTFLLIPNTKTFSWNYSSLFALGVIGNLLFQCCSSGVREMIKLSPQTLLVDVIDRDRDDSWKP